MLAVFGDDVEPNCRPLHQITQAKGVSRMNRLRFRSAIVWLAAVCTANWVVASEPERVPLRVLYLSRTNDDERTVAFTEFLTQHFTSCRTESREGFQQEFIKDVDVVVLDWSQDERLSSKVESPIGRLEDWKHPIVLVGSAGLLLSQAWQVIGDAG
jgi:hypothetical protein